MHRGRGINRGRGGGKPLPKQSSAIPHPLLAPPSMMTPPSSSSLSASTTTTKDASPFPSSFEATVIADMMRACRPLFEDECVDVEVLDAIHEAWLANLRESHERNRLERTTRIGGVNLSVRGLMAPSSTTKLEPSTSSSQLKDTQKTPTVVDKEAAAKTIKMEEKKPPAHLSSSSDTSSSVSPQLTPSYFRRAPPPSIVSSSVVGGSDGVAAIADPKPSKSPQPPPPKMLKIEKLRPGAGMSDDSSESESEPSEAVEKAIGGGVVECGDGEDDASVSKAADTEDDDFTLDTGGFNDDDAGFEDADDELMTPLNSGDDDSEIGELEVMANVENVILCQYSEVKHGSGRDKEWRVELTKAMAHIDDREFQFVGASARLQWETNVVVSGTTAGDAAAIIDDVEDQENESD